jgi:hypothetical protein
MVAPYTMIGLFLLLLSLTLSFKTPAWGFRRIDLINGAAPEPTIEDLTSQPKWKRVLDKVLNFI